MEILEFLLGYLSKTQNKTEEEIKSLILKDDDSGELKDDFMADVLNLDTERVAGFNETLKTEKQEQYDRAKREVSEDWEKRIKNTFSLSDTDKIGDELIAEARAIIPAASGDGDTLTDDDVKQHAVYQALQRDHSTAITDLTTEWEGKMEKKEAEYNRSNTLSSVSKAALTIAKGLNPKLPDNAQMADIQLGNVVTQLKSLGYEFKPNGNSFDVMKDGELAKDSHNKLIDFNELVEGITKGTFELGEGDGGGGTGGGTGNTNDFNDKKFKNVKVPNSPEALKDALDNAKTSEDRETISKAYIEAKKASAE